MQLEGQQVLFWTVEMESLMQYLFMKDLPYPIL